MMHQRTTFTPSPSVAKAIQELARKEGKSISTVVDELLQSALGLRPTQDTKRKAFVVKASPLHLRPGIDPTRLREVLSDLKVEGR